MGGFRIKDTRAYRNLTLFKTLCRMMNARPGFFFISTFSSFIIAFFDGLSVGLLVPLAKGVIDQNFSFLEKAPVFKTVIACFPELFVKAPAKFLFALLVLIIFTAAMAKSVLQYVFALYLSYQKEKYHFNLKNFIFGRYLSFGKLFFDKTSQGELSKILDFSEKTVELFRISAEMLKITFTLGVYFTIMLLISWKLTMFAVIILPVLHYSVRWVIKKLEKTVQFWTSTMLRLSREVFNILSCIPLVKAYNREEQTKRKYSDTNDLLRGLSFSIAKKTELIQPLQDIIMLVALLLLISAAAFVFIKGKLGEISGFLIFFYVIRRSVPYFASFNVFKSYMAEAKAPTKEILGILDYKDKFFVSEGTRVFSELRKGIEFRHLNFRYTEDVLILKNLSFLIEKGKMTAIVGPTGAGKTTIINLIMRFYECPPATIFIDDVDMREFTSKSLRTHMAFVSQDALLFNDTLKYNIAFGVEEKASEENLIDAARKARLYDFVMGLPERFDAEIGDRGIRLSGGEKQRVSIARAFLKEAEILILDEATSSLDTHTEKLIQGAIEEAVKGRTTIVIAHRLSTIKNADKIIVIENGRFVEEGALNELLEKKGTFYRYWEEQKFY